MFYLALGLIGGGLVLLLAFFVSIAVQRKEETSSQREPAREPASRPPELPPWRARTPAPSAYAKPQFDGRAVSAPHPASKPMPSPQDLVVSGILFLDPARRVRDESARSGDV